MMKKTMGPGIFHITTTILLLVNEQNHGARKFNTTSTIVILYDEQNPVARKF